MLSKKPSSRTSGVKQATSSTWPFLVNLPSHTPSKACRLQHHSVQGCARPPKSNCASGAREGGPVEVT